VTVVFTASDCTFPAVARLSAWLYTGPVGHLIGGVADWTELLSRYAWHRLRR